MAHKPNDWLRGLWYLAARATDVKAGRVISKQLLSEPILIGRTTAGKLFAIRDVCPHRGIPLSKGTFDGEAVTCCFHGWRYGPDGRCLEIPSLAPGRKVRLDRIRVPDYACLESQGLLWIFFPKHTAKTDTKDIPPAPFLNGLPEDAAPQIFGTVSYPCHADNAAYNLMDPAHAAFIHGSWWWRSKQSRLILKEKILEPAERGWRIARHKVARYNRAYRLLGRDVTSEITYHLPGLRIEEIRGDKHVVFGLSAVTPVSEHASEVTQCFYSDLPWLHWLSPVGRHFIKKFLSQDRAIAVLSDQSQIENFRPIHIPDADIQARYYAQLQAAWRRASDGKAAFHNPVRRQVVRWYS